MKKLFSISLALLLAGMLSGSAFATGIPEVVDVDYPIVWTETVYNGSGTDIATGRVVQWDFDTSDPSGNDYDDMCPYVKTADAAGDIWTAGVSLIDNGISNGNIGTIIIKGPAIVNDNGNSVTADDLVETDASGYVTSHDGNATDESTLGICIKDDHPDYYTSAIIYVNPVAYDKD